MNTWAANSSDVCINVFLQARAEWGLEMEPGSRIVEIGCSEANWMSRAKAAVPNCSILGIDVRPSKWTEGIIIQGDVRNVEIAPGSVDWIVLISALEHIGLGHYQDPVFTDGDQVTLQLAAKWLTPTGQMYFDIPFTDVPGGGYVNGTSERVYDQERLNWLKPGWVERATFCSPKEKGSRPWVYKAHWWQRNGS